MTAHLAWLVFWVGTVTGVVGLLSLFWRRQEVLWLAATVATTIATGWVVYAEPTRADALSKVIASASIVFVGLSLVKDRERRRSDERRQRNLHLFTEWRAFSENERFFLPSYMLEVDDARLKRLGGRLDESEYRAWKHALDQLFDFLQRFAYAAECDEVDPRAVANAVGWYYRRCHDLEHVRDYCMKTGYETVVAFAKVHVHSAPKSLSKGK